MTSHARCVLFTHDAQTGNRRLVSRRFLLAPFVYGERGCDGGPEQLSVRPGRRRCRRRLGGRPRRTSYAGGSRCRPRAGRQATGTHSLLSNLTFCSWCVLGQQHGLRRFCGRLIGYLFLRPRCEPAQLLLGIVLGPMMEENFRWRISLWIRNTEARISGIGTLSETGFVRITVVERRELDGPQRVGNVLRT